jgi:hypothetical protein
LPARSKQIEPAITLEKHDLTAIAADNNDHVFGATPEGIVAIDIGRRVATALTASKGVSLGGIHALRWHGGTLVAVQQGSDGLHRIVRIRLDSAGLRATRLEVLEKGVTLSSPTLIVIADGTFFYVTTANGDREVVIRKITLRR